MKKEYCKSNLLLWIFSLQFVFVPLVDVKAQPIQYGLQVGGGATSVYNFLPAAEKALRDTEWGIPIAYPVLSYGAAFYVSSPLNDNFSWALEPGFVVKGYSQKYVDEYEMDLIHNQRYLNYFQLPVLLEMRFKENSWISFGPEIGYLLRAKQKTYDGIDPIDLMHYYSKNKIDVGVQGGLFWNLSANLDGGFKLGASVKPMERFFIQSEEHDVLIRITKRNIYLQFFARMKF